MTLMTIIILQRTKPSNKNKGVIEREGDRIS